MILSTIFAFAAGIVGGALFGATSAVVLGATIAGYVGALLVYGGVALALSNKNSDNYSASSPTYATGQKVTQTNQDLPVPLLYGTVKLAGNRIWQSDDSNTVKRIVAFAEGEITGYEDIRLNDIAVGKTLSTVYRYYGTSSQGLPSLGVSLNGVGSLKNIAYLGLKTPITQTINENYNLTAVVKGRKIRVYSTTETYEVKYSENPVWVCFDFLTSYNGLGIALNDNGSVSNTKIAELFDLNSFIESASFCDELVTTYGVQTPRFTFNMIFDAQSSARDLLDEIYRSCRGGLFVKNGKLQFKIDKAEPVSKVFYEKDILQGSESFWTIPAEEKYEKLKLVYISPRHEWQKIEAYAELETFKNAIPVENSVNCFSITNFQQASRLAWYYLNRNVICPYFGEFSTGYKAFDLEIGDVIEINSILMGLESYKVKITSITDDGTGVFKVSWRNYDERLYADTLGCLEPTVLVSNLGDIYAFPDDVTGFNVVQKDNLFNFVWNYNQSSTDEYEIRMGTTWETGEIIASNIKQNNYSAVIPSTGTYRFWIKAFNKYNYSQNPTMDIIAVQNIPNMNEVVSFNLLEEPNGEFNGTYIYNNKLKLAANEVLWHSTENFWGQDEYYQNNNLWGAKVIEYGQYISQIYDIGAILTSSFSFDFESLTYDEQNDVVFEWRYSENNTDWSEWKTVNIGGYMFRYCQFRVTLNAYNQNPIVVTKATAKIDVPDKFEVLEAEITNAQTGITINYNFTARPSIVATVSDRISAYAVYDKDNATNKQAQLFAYDNSGVLTTAKITVYLKGY